MKAKLKLMMLSVGSLILSGGSWSVKAQEGLEIIRYCAKPELNYQQTVTFGAPQQVILNQGGFMLLESDSDYQVTEQLITRELIKAGVAPDCAEYLMSKSKVTQYAVGELVARVYFAFDMAELTPESKYVLDTMVRKLGNTRQHFLLEGHTDNVGTPTYNFQLGMRRADSVRAYLVTQQMPDKQLQAVSKGESNPIQSNRTNQGREANRRVDIVAAP